MALAAASTRAVAECAFVAVAFVASLYVWPRARVPGLRDAPDVIVARSLGVLVVALAACGLLGQPLHSTLGRAPLDLAPALPVLALFLGPLCERAYLDATALVPRISWPSFRTLLYAPLAEELVFRALMLPRLVEAGHTHGGALGVSALVFALGAQALPVRAAPAHSHSSWASRVVDTRSASGCVASVRVLLCDYAPHSLVFQVGYTTVFALLAGVIFLRSGLLAAVAAHIFCNWMGFPEFEFLDASLPLAQRLALSTVAILANPPLPRPCPLMRGLLRACVLWRDCAALPPRLRPCPRLCSSATLFDTHGEPVPSPTPHPRYDKSLLKQGSPVPSADQPYLTKEVAPVTFTPAQEAAARWLFDDRTQLSWAMCATVDELMRVNESGTALPEVCFFGKSNAGKSSLLNALLRARAARVGARPGVTQAVHMLELRGMLRVVDLPGYGHAAASAPDLVRLTRLLQAYLGLPSIARPPRRYAHLPPAASAKARARARAELRSKVQRRSALVLLCVLIDARRGVGDHEEALFDDLDALGTPYVLVLTKCDKLKDGELSVAQAQVEATLHKHPRAYPEAICTSALTGEGVGRLRTLLAQAVRPMSPPHNSNAR